MSELSPEARDLIESTLHSDNPSDADRARVRARLAAQLGAVAVASSLGAASSTMVSASAGSVGTGAGALSAPAAASKGAFGVGLFKVVVATGLASVIGGSITWFARQPEHVPSRIVSAGTHASSVPESLPAAGQPTVEPMREPVEQAASPGEIKSEAEQGRKRDRVSVRRVADAPQGESSLSEELSLLATAQQALRDGEPRLALARAEDHRRRFPHGSLREERFGIEALARCALGDDGAEVVDELARLSPSSPLLARVRAACERTP